MRALLITALLAPLQAQPEEVRPPVSGRTVQVEEIDGDKLCTLVVQDESVRRVLTDLCRELGIELEGFEGVQRSALVTADLRRRPVERVLEYVLGSVGLRSRVRTGVLSVTEETLLAADQDELLLRASAAYLDAHAEHPGHPLGAEARVNQGRIEEMRGNLNAALEHYQVVAADHGTSPAAAEALFRSGLLYEELLEWGQASLVFRQLVNLRRIHDFEGVARQELARCFVHMAEEHQALSTLDLLERRYPTEDVRHLVTRRILRAHALLGLEEYVECLGNLERLEGLGLRRAERLESQSIRARAFEGLGLMDEAGRTWLIYAREADQDDHERALHRAVRIALEADDELAVLFAVAQARTPELREELAPMVRQARDRLGLAMPLSQGLTVEERLARAEAEIAAGRTAEIADWLRPLAEGRRSLDDDSRVRLAVAWASVLNATTGLDEAVAFLAAERVELTALPAKSRLDVRAAELFEAQDRFEEAIEAYEGRY